MVFLKHILYFLLVIFIIAFLNNFVIFGMDLIELNYVHN